MKIDSNNDLVEIKMYNSRIYYISLALENYFDNRHENKELIDEGFAIIKDFRQQRTLLDNTKLLKLSKNVLEKLDCILNSLGKEKFVFYDDGSIEYKWDNSLLREKKDGNK